MELNLNTLRVDENGRVSFSGLGSGIDFEAAVDAMIDARSVRVDLLQTQVDTNTRRIAALGDLKSKLGALKTALSTLYGSVSFGDTQNIFAAKQAFANASRIDGTTASAPASLVGVSVTNAADAGNHVIEILRTAKAHKVSSDSVADQTAVLGFADGDTFTINGQTITVNASTSLLDLRDVINNANSGANATGVTASIVTVSTSEHYLLFTADETGQTMTLSDTAGASLQSIGILDTGGAIKNEIQAAQTAQLYADGVLDQTDMLYESDWQNAATGLLGSSGTIEFTDNASSTAIGNVTYSATDTLEDLAANITANVAGVTATVVSDGTGARLEISGTSAFSMAETGGGSALGDLGINNKRRVIERETNTISDLFNGVTLSLFQAEPGTTIGIDIEQDLSKVKEQVVGFVEAYNNLRMFINEQRQLVDGEPDESEDSLKGVLFSSSALRQIDQSLARLVGSVVPGLSEEFNVLTQTPIANTVTTGINFIDRSDVTDPLLAGTLVIDESKLDEALLNNADDIRKLFGFDFSASDSRVTLLGFDGNTTYTPGGYTLNYDPVAGTANIGGLADGSDDGSVTVDGDVLTVNTGPAQGLKLFVNGFTATANIDLDYTVGVGASLFFTIDRALDTQTGVVETEIENLTDTNEANETRIEEMKVRLEIERQDLLARFLRMETALATANRMLESIKQTSKAMFGDDDN